ncbi:cfem domain-containing [Pyrenophora seminiperda CCB06]|uniref:Cfem domain-containing n=1 Tax=Pyrenophora seminiperda CCB06 TaxID=1302712 RepID=A0A3M7LXK4_9PLEO|nr:cfem domain-containing [Pyrenophora seminiperda CCB06]
MCATKNATATICHAPIRDQGATLRIANIALASVTAFCALTRVIYKAVFSIGELGWDDYSVVAALVAGVPSVIIIDRGIVPNGLGRDVWTVSFDRITNFVRYLYALEILYFLQLALLKLTLLFFFLRIFPKTIIRRLLWATIWFNVLNGIAFIIVAIFQCQPLSFYWTKWDLEGTGKCIDINGLAWTSAIISIVLDIWMLALPLFEVFQLQLSWRKKLSVAVMFCVGTFVTVISILRLQSLVNFAASSNPTWDQSAVIKWSNIEVNVGIICACLPALRVILVRMFPKMMGTTKATDKAYYAYGSQSRGLKKGESALGSASVPGTAISTDPNSITYTKTFEVRRTDSDEHELVQMEMNEFGSKKANPQSSSTSISSL